MSITCESHDKKEKEEDLTDPAPISEMQVSPAAPAAEWSPDERRVAESLVTALRKILSNPSEHMDSTERALIAVRPPGEATELTDAESRVEPDLYDCLALLQPGVSEDVLARQLTCHLITESFGANAIQAELFVDGIAGVAAARAGVGPTLEQADRWVQDEISSGRSVVIVARNRRRARTPKERTNGVFNLAATSFVAFLLAQSGPEALRKYLESYDPNRKDHAAVEAYHEPLAVLQDEWLAKLRSRVDEGDVLRSFLGHVIPLLRPYKWKHLEILGYLLLAAAFNVVQPYAVKIFIDRLPKHPPFDPSGLGAGTLFMQSLAPFLLLLLGLYVLNGVVSLRRTYTVNWLNQNILNTLQVRMYAHLQQLPHSFYVRAKIGDIMSRLNSDLDNVQQALSQVTNKALYRGFTIVGAVTALIMLTRKSPELAIPILCIIPLFGMAYYSLRTRNKQASREQRLRVGQTMATVQEHLSAHALIKAFGMENGFITDYQRRIWTLQKSKMRLAMLSALSDLSEDMTTGLAQLIVFGVGGYLVIRDNGHGLGVGDIAALLILVKSIFSPIASLSGIGQTMQQATGSLERVFELFKEPITIADKPDAIALPPLSDAIRFENVSFRYGGDRPALTGLSLEIRAGEHVAIVGPSGSGKSTLINLLLRFWDPEEGRVVFDGHDLRDVTLASLRGQIGLVFQETFIFNTTLRANIAMGRPDASDVEIVASAKAARLDDFIDSLPAGYDTVPGEHGARLSVGQKQRIAIARTFLRNPPILILDEATSALDAATETGILETLSELTKGRTTISITHRISQAAVADRILVMKDGRLVEQGRHADLIRAGGQYQELYEDASEFAISGLNGDSAVALV